MPPPGGISLLMGGSTSSAGGSGVLTCDPGGLAASVNLPALVGSSNIATTTTLATTSGRTVAILAIVAATVAESIHKCPALLINTAITIISSPSLRAASWASIAAAASASVGGWATSRRGFTPSLQPSSVDNRLLASGDAAAMAWTTSFTALASLRRLPWSCRFSGRSGWPVR